MATRSCTPCCAKCRRASIRSGWRWTAGRRSCKWSGCWRFRGWCWAGLQVIALGLILKARIAWAFSLVLLIGVGTFAILGDSGHAGLGIYTLVLILALMAYWRRFDRASVTAGSLFALVSVLSLLIYAVFGTLYLGDEFNPPVHDAGTALYFSIVSMSTVGYGDITPHSGAARCSPRRLSSSASRCSPHSVSAIAGPVIGGNLKRLVRADSPPPERTTSSSRARRRWRSASTTDCAGAATKSPSSCPPACRRNIRRRPTSSKATRPASRCCARPA